MNDCNFRPHRKTERALPAPPLSKYMLNKLAMQQQQHQQQQAERAHQHKRRGDALSPAHGGSGAAGGGAIALTDLYVPRTKRAKVIVPEGELLLCLKLLCIPIGHWPW